VYLRVCRRGVYQEGYHLHIPGGVYHEGYHPVYTRKGIPGRVPTYTPRYTRRYLPTHLGIPQGAYTPSRVYHRVHIHHPGYTLGGEPHLPTVLRRRERPLRRDLPVPKEERETSAQRPSGH